MTRTALFAALLAPAVALAAPPPEADSFRSPPLADSLAAGQQTIAREAKPAKAGAIAPTALTIEEVGDPDTFGKPLKWLGLVSINLLLTDNCSPVAGEPALENCIQLAPAPATTPINATDLASITLPGRSAETLLCHWQTPIVSYSLANYTGAPAQYAFRLSPTYRFESEVLDDPALINPATGLPFGGSLSTTLTSVNRFGTLQPDDYEVQYESGTRMCIGGVLSQRSLVQQWGLTEAQARRFFRRPITIVMGLSGNARLVESASINFGTRFVGD
ncbi:hypothetical protein [Arenimonas metalli]|uniref:Uncharacterized protein n=1 Tax=Arenimonas metalli CF5-1 TaxID=1384056 RepID=A0A091ASG4_9GAMM|nr:hypothetical protein [Arenimonas metalli]KFN42306.1 hypothetical protein N787_14140 [Arenimonas metalli CF5-1]